MLLLRASLIAQSVKNLPVKQETQAQSLGQEDPLEKGMATHSSIFAWRIPWTEEPGSLDFMGSQESDTTEWRNHHSGAHFYRNLFADHPSKFFSFCITERRPQGYWTARLNYWVTWGLALKQCKRRKNVRSLHFFLITGPCEPSSYISPWTPHESGSLFFFFFNINLFILIGG